MYKITNGLGSFRFVSIKLEYKKKNKRELTK